MNKIESFEIESFESVPDHYKNSYVFKMMIFDERFKTLSFEEFKKTQSFYLIRSNSPITDIDDFDYTLKTLDYWIINKLPLNVLNYIKSKELFFLSEKIFGYYVFMDDWNKCILDFILLNKIKITPEFLKSIDDPIIKNKLKTKISLHRGSIGGNKNLNCKNTKMNTSVKTITQGVIRCRFNNIDF